MRDSHTLLSETEGPKKQKTILVILAWLLVASWAALIFYMSSNTGSDLSDEMGFFSQIYQQLNVFQENIFGPGVDVMSPIAHFSEYLVFGILLANALRQHMPLRRACIVAIVCASAYGVTDEFHQYFVPDRMCDPLDWLVDTIGASIGVGVFSLIVNRHVKKDASVT